MVSLFNKGNKMISKLAKIMDSNEGSLKILIPLFHRVFGMMFAEMEKNGVDSEWYRDTLGSLLAAASFMVYKDPAKDFARYANMVDDEYDEFAKEFDKMPSA